MKVLFYSPFAKADGSEPSGAVRMAHLLVRALEGAGASVTMPALPRTFDGKGDGAQQQVSKLKSEDACDALLQLIKQGNFPKPDLWFSYHVYYKSPDWIGPRVARTLGIPYVVAEGSYAPKRVGGPWNNGHVASTEALKSANLLLAMTHFDQFCLEQLCPGRVHLFAPFTDVPLLSKPLPKMRQQTQLIAVGMMRNFRKRDSYLMLANALSKIQDIRLGLQIAGDGVLRGEIEGQFESVRRFHDVEFLGALPRNELFLMLSQSDIFTWSGIGEAYGLAYLEAQACGLPVAGCRERGVVDVVIDGETALLCDPGDTNALSDNIRRLAVDMKLREKMSANARAFVRAERTVETASVRLKALLSNIVR